MVVERHFNTGDIESIICRLKGIVAVSVVAAVDGDIAEIHVLASAGRSPKQVVRDVESALMARLGCAVDHKKISVAQVDDGISQIDHSRLKFSDVNINLNGSATQATVRLAKDGVVFAGSADGASSPIAQMKLIASATLRAIEESGTSNGGITLEDVTEVMAGNRRVALVLVNLITSRGEDILTGSAVIKQDVWKGVVNATLDAVNRRLAVQDH